MKELSQAEVLARLGEEVERAGSGVKWAKAAGISHSYVAKVRRGEGPPSDRLLRAIGVERVTIFRELQR